MTSIRWSFPLSTEAIWKSTLKPSSSVSALFTVVSDSLLGEPSMFSSFTRDGSMMVMSEPESSRPKVVIWLPDLLITRTGMTWSNTSHELPAATVEHIEIVAWLGLKSWLTSLSLGPSRCWFPLSLGSVKCNNRDLKIEVWPSYRKRQTAVCS